MALFRPIAGRRRNDVGFPVPASSLTADSSVSGLETKLLCPIIVSSLYDRG